MFVPLMAFFAKVSDPAIGGTYMTLLNTVCNFGKFHLNSYSDLSFENLCLAVLYSCDLKAVAPRVYQA
jgi:Acetyl-coenzyme A transporter 1